MIKNRWDKLDPLLIELWNDYTIPAKEIAKRLGPGVTKNAVIGRAHRLHLRPRPFRGGRGMMTHPSGIDRPSKRRATIANKKPRSRAKVVRAPPPPPPPPEPPPPPPPVLVKKEPFTYSILELNHRTCRWPEGKQPPYLYCGQDIVTGSYCMEHARLSYTGIRAAQPGGVRWR